jgi:staphylococcal nuclease domain-containing protein 1
VFCATPTLTPHPQASTGTVKAVISGDTIVLMGAARPGGPPPEMQVSLSSVSAPRLGREAVPDEAYAWASREYIRTNALGKAVRFQMDYKGGNRQYATVMMGDDVSLNERVVRAGLATVRKAGGDAASKSREYDTLVEAEAAASAAKAGMHAEGPGGTRSVKWSLTPAEAEELVATNKDVPMKGIIEHVRDGASFSILLALDKKEAKYVKISLALSGVVCPRVNPRGKGKAAPPAAPAAAPPAAAAADADADAPPPPPAAAAANPAEPFALEARHFSETRLLNRELDVCLEGVDSYGNIFGTINHPSGSIGCVLLCCCAAVRSRRRPPLPPPS